MHFYRFNIKDYAVNTTHLTNEEDLAYRRLLDLYYTDDQPKPNNNQWVCRRIRIAAEVVDVVLNEFFVLTENGWICGRVEEEIEGYRNLCRKRKEVGASGGRPPKKQAKPKGKQDETNRLAIAPIPVTNNQYISPIVPTGDMELEIEETPERKTTHPVLTRFRNLFNLRESTPLDSSSSRAWEKNKKAAAAVSEDDWRYLEWAYRQKEGAAAQFRRKDLATLLNNILAEVTRARDWAGREGVSLSASASAPMEPSGWRDLIETEFPEVNLSTWANLPDSMKSWVREKQRELAAA
jgi:uncharacterized protein YdaU (DUF1376 family)